MKLELANFPVKNVRFSKQTAYNGGVLEINKEELLSLVKEDNKITSADIDVASPSERTRIVNIRDVVEPRVKVSGPGCVFPGILGPVETVGDGRTHRLSGVTVIPSVRYRPTVLSGTAAQVAGLVDMWGRGAQVTPFGSTINIVLVFKLIDTITEAEAHTTIQMAEFKVARRLAETTRKKTPEDVETFALSTVDAALPRIVYILGYVTDWHDSHTGIAYYGLPVKESLPTLIHPNELLDGALTADARRGGGIRVRTWDCMNHPMIVNLLREHGKRLNFLGVILERTEFKDELGKKATSMGAAQMAWLMQADGAVITRTVTSGNAFIDITLAVQACEKKGIKTVFLTPEWGGKYGNELPLLFYVPEETAVVSTGSFEHEINLGKPDKVIGIDGKDELVRYAPLDEPYSPWGELSLREWGRITSGIDWWGGGKLTCRTS